MDFKKMFANLVALLGMFFFGQWFAAQGYNLIPNGKGDQLASSLLLLVAVSTFLAYMYAKKNQTILIVTVIIATASVAYLILVVTPEYRINWENSISSLLAATILIGLASASQIKKSPSFH